MYFLSNDLQLKDAIVLAYGDSMMARNATGTDSGAVRFVKTYQEDSYDCENEEGADDPYTGIYSIISEIAVECSVIPVLVLSISQLSS